MSGRTDEAIYRELDNESTPHYETAQAEADRQEAAFSAMKYDVWSRPAVDWSDIVTRAEIVRRHLDPGRDGRLVVDLDDCCDDRERALIDLALSVLRVAGREG